MGDAPILQRSRRTKGIIVDVDVDVDVDEGGVAAHFHRKRAHAACIPVPVKGKLIKSPKPQSYKAIVKSKETQTESIADIEDCLSGVTDFREEEASAISKCLIQWYDENHRVLPWRSNQGGEEGDEQSRAYAVWVSEVMLQQTRVATVVSYYDRWMGRWPTLHHLAQASQEEVNDIWAGLGYYRRARYLLEGAKEIVEKQGGVFPHTRENLKKVPGIGDYTAGAIASIAFKQAVPVVDGNVIRVLCRLKAVSANPKLSTTVKRLWELASQLVDPKIPGDFNQALMELGATICTPTSPTCSSCPVAEHCNAFAIVRRYDSENEHAVQSLSTVYNAVEAVTAPSVTDYPMKVLKPKPREEFAAVCVVEMSPENVTENFLCIRSERNLFLLVKRPQQGLLAGLWEFPSVLNSGFNLSLNERKAAMDQYLKSSLGIQTSQGTCKEILRKSVGQYIHVFSHIRLHMYIEWMVLHVPDGLHGMQENKDENGTVVKWVDKKAIHSMGLTSGVRKVYTMIQEFKNGQGTGKSVKKMKKK
jgi:A/G-specific adenine glycosylase